MKRFVAMIAMSLILSVSASGQTPQSLTNEQLAVLKNTAEALVLAELCPRLRENTDISFLAFVQFKLTDERIKDRVAAAFREAVSKARAETSSLIRRPDAACGVALFMFGPTGQNVPNLLLAR